MSLPSKPGFYFAKPPGYDWWRYILCVYGTLPYLRIKGWDQTEDRVVAFNPSGEIKSYIFKEIEE